jgi:hypothetical protein
MLVGQAATSAARVAPGARVRVTLPHEQPRTAVVVAHTPDTLFVRWADLVDTAALPLGKIASLEVSTGRHRSVAKGAGMGTLIGVGAGAILGALTYSPCDGLNCIVSPGSRGEATLYGGAAGGMLGLVVGSLVGLKSHEDWERVSLTPRLASSPSFGTAFRITLSF